MPDHITRDPIYNAVDRDDFDAMIEIDRYHHDKIGFDRARHGLRQRTQNAP